MKRMKTAKTISFLMVLLLVLQLVPLGTALATQDGSESADPESLVTPLPEDEGGEPVLDTGEDDTDTEAPTSEGEDLALDEDSPVAPASDGVVLFADESTETPKNIGGTGWVLIHNTKGEPDSGFTDDAGKPIDPLKSSIVVKSGATIIDPDSANVYPTISAGSTIELQVAFHLLDRAEGSVTYKSGDFFYVDLPKGIVFNPIGSTLFSSWGRWELESNRIKVTLTDALEDSDFELWGLIKINGVFQARENGDGAGSGTIKFGDQTFTIPREEYEPPVEEPKLATLVKTGTYDASRNAIDWTVSLTAPDGETLNGTKFIDTLTSGNHTYIDGTFEVRLNEELPEAKAPAVEGGKWTYAFPADGDPITKATISYSTTPTGNNWSSNQTFKNRADLLKDTNSFAKPGIGSVTVPALFTKDGQASPSNADPSIIKWEVKVNVPSLSPAGEVTLKNAKITDKMDSRLDRLESSPYKPQIKFGNALPTDITSDIGTLSIVDPSTNSFTFVFEDGQVKTGTTVTLIYYTKVKDAAWQAALESNGAIKFTNDASFSWEFDTGSGVGNSPTIKAGVTKNIVAGGLLNKTVDGPTDKVRTVSYNSTIAGQDDYIKWVVTVNANRVELNDAVLADTIPVGQELFIDAGTHIFTVSSTGDTPVNATYTDFDDDGNLTFNSPVRNGFTYTFPSSIDEKYTFTFWTRIIDVNPGSKTDTAGKDQLYLSNPAAFSNGSKLEYQKGSTSVTENSSATKNFTTDMLKKEDIGGYKYNDRAAEWKLTVNSSKLPMTNAKITDSLPKSSDSTQMVLVGNTIDAFTIKVNGAVKTAAEHGVSLTSTTPDAKGRIVAFELALPTSTSSTFEITYKTTLPDDALIGQWTTDKTFENDATLALDEKAAGYIAKDSVSVRNPVVRKNGAYTKNDAEITWTVDINPGMITLNNAQIVDVMTPSGVLEFDPDSVELYKVGVNQNGSLKTGDMTPANLVSKGSGTTQYRLTYSEASPDTFTLELPDGPHAYILTYKTSIKVNSANNIRNSVSMSGDTSPNGSVNSTAITVTDQFSAGGKGNYQLKVKKVDADDSSKVIEGADFKLVAKGSAAYYKQSGSELTPKTGSDGIATFTGLPGWEFYVEEITPAHGYLLPANPRSTDAYKPEKSAPTVHQLVIANKLGSADVEIFKVDGKGAALSGGAFQLKGKDYKGDTITINSEENTNGTVTFKNVPLNAVGETYKISELTAPGGHDVSAEIIEVTVGYNGDKTQAIVSYPADRTIQNLPTPLTSAQVSFTKTGLSGIPVSGARFKLTGTSLGTPVTIADVAPDASGKVIFNGITIGDYTIYETTVPDGYLNPNAAPSTTPILDVKVDYNKERTALVVDITEHAGGPGYYDGTTFKNAPAVADVVFTKKSSASDSILINGGTFQIKGKAVAGFPVDGDGDYVATATAVNGIVTFPNVPVNEAGKSYTIEELVSPSGYHLTKDKLTVEVKYTSGDKLAVADPVFTGTNILKNDPIPYSPGEGKATVLKTDEDGKPLAGATFTLYNAAGGTVASMVSGADGLAVFEKLLPDSSFTIRETAAPEGYVLSTETISFKTGDGTTHSFTMVNKKKAPDGSSIELHKVNEDGNSLPGATFTLYDKDGNAIATAVSDSNGLARFTGIPVGSYTIRETAAPEGYLLSGQTLSLTLEKGDNRSFTFVNTREGDVEDPIEPTGSIGLLKTNTDGQRLAGAEFSLYGPDGTLIERAVTGSDGIARFTKLPYGSYTVRETAAPAGYQLFDGALPVEISAAAPDRSFTLRNAREDEPGIGGWEEEEPDIGGWEDGGNPGGKLPQTGGVPQSLFLLLAGIALLGAGIFTLKSRKKQSSAAPGTDE